MIRQLGQAAVASGWRSAVADRLSSALAAKTPATTDQLRAAAGVLFFFAAARYVASTVWRMRSP